MPRGAELKAACFSAVFLLCLSETAVLLSRKPSLPVYIQSSSSMEALLPGGERLHAPTVAGMAVEMAGAGLKDTGLQPASCKLITGFLLLPIGMATWSVRFPYLPAEQQSRAHPIIVGAVRRPSCGTDPFSAPCW